MFFCWITTRRQLLSPGYGWLLRGVFGGLALIQLLVSGFNDFEVAREIAAIVLIGLAAGGVFTSILESRAAREGDAQDVKPAVDNRRRPAVSHWLDLLAALAGLFGAAAGGVIAGGPVWLAVIRFLMGAMFMGALTDTMLLGHWYLVQPGLTRNPLKELLYWVGLFWLVELVVWLLPTGMISVLNGSVQDGHNGLLGWFWAASTAMTLLLTIGGIAALKERGYQAVMAVTGLAYLSLLTGFAQDIVARLALDSSLN